MKKTTFNLVVLFSILFSGCNVSNPQNEIDKYSDEAIKELVYSGAKYPNGFFQENSEIFIQYIRNYETVSFYEPATNEYHIAIELVNLRLNEISLDKSRLVDGDFSEKYFEFKWLADSVTTNHSFLFRVHKDNYFEGVTFGSTDQNRYQIIELGRINYRPFTIESLKEFFDRLWYFKHYNLVGAKVIERFVSEDQSNYNYRISATMTSFGDYGIQDKIIIIETIFNVNKVSGLVQIENNLLKTVKGNYN